MLAPSAPPFTGCLTWLPSGEPLRPRICRRERHCRPAVRLLTLYDTLRIGLCRLPSMDLTNGRCAQPHDAHVVSGIPFISQLRGLSSIAPKDAWETLVKQAASCNASNNYDDERCWNPAAAPDGLHPSTQIGQTYMGHALRLWLRRAYDRHCTGTRMRLKSHRSSLSTRACVRLLGFARSHAA